MKIVTLKYNVKSESLKGYQTENNHLEFMYDILIGSSLFNLYVYTY